jgi:predicted alternative tryptophan synthase beta-subunit
MWSRICQTRLPPLGPDGQPIGPDALAAIFPNAIVEQEVSAERWIEIPEAVREIYRLWRPSPDPAVTCIIPATSKVHHMQDNMMAGYGRLPDEKMRN